MNPEIPWVVAAGGSQGELAIWDVSETKAIEKHFKEYLIAGSYDASDYNKDAVDDDYESMDEDEDGNEDDMQDEED